MLPFGLQSAPKIVTDAMEWSLWQRSVENVNYHLDDFITMGPPDSTARACALASLCTDLGVPLAIDKLEGPSSHIAFWAMRLTPKPGFCPASR